VLRVVDSMARVEGSGRSGRVIARRNCHRIKTKGGGTGSSGRVPGVIPGIGVPDRTLQHRRHRRGSRLGSTGLCPVPLAAEKEPGDEATNRGRVSATHNTVSAVKRMNEMLARSLFMAMKATTRIVMTAPATYR
jgi:hypothetical protein